MSFAVQQQNAGAEYVMATGSENSHVSARIWEAQEYTSDYSFGMPELRAGAIQGFGTTLCPSQHPGLTISHLFLVSDSIGATHMFDPVTGWDSITGISPGASFVYIMFVTAEEFGCSHQTIG